MKLRTGLIGLGPAWEQRHGPALRALSDWFEIRAVCEQVSHRAEAAAATFKATTVDSFRMLVQREDIDVILILSNQWYGHLPILAACDAGKAIYCCASMSLDARQTMQIKQRVDESGIAFMAEFPRRFSPASVRLKELIATGQLGQPELLFCHRRSPLQQNGVNRGTVGMHPTTADEVVELVDWCRFVVGKEPTCVTGIWHDDPRHAPRRDYMMLSLDFSGETGPGTGPLAQISVGRYIPGRWKEAIGYRPLADLQVSCERGTAFVDLPSTLIWFDDAGRHQESLEAERPVGELLLSQFHRAVTSLVRRTLDLEDTYRALMIVQRAEQSFREGRRISLDDI